MDCDERFTSAHQEAIIEYDDVDGEFPSGPEPDYLQANRTGLVERSNCKFHGVYNKRVSFVANKSFKQGKWSEWKHSHAGIKVT